MSRNVEIMAQQINAQAVRVDYIRSKCYVGAVINHDGIHEGIVNDVLQTRIQL